MLSQAAGRSRARLVRDVGRGVSSSAPAAASHYDVLGLTPKATQHDIKSAYYKLSMLHHPDKSSDESSVRKFRAITEAYEVLGNISSKRLYDKSLAHGLHAAHGVHAEHPPPDEEPPDPVVRFYRSRINRHMTATIDGKKPVYDFDAWTKQHYGELFKQSNRDRQSSRTRQEKSTIMNVSLHQDAKFYLIITLFCMVGVLLTAGESYDRDLLASKRDDKPTTKS